MSEIDLYRTALNKAMAMCSKKECCRHDIIEKAASWGIGRAESEKIIDSLTKEKFIDEQRYASAFVRDKFNHNRWGKVKIAAGLKMKGLPSDLIRESLELIDNDEYRQALEKLISVQRKKVKAGNQYELKGKLMRFALSRGFENWLIYEILGEE